MKKTKLPLAVIAGFIIFIVSAPVYANKESAASAIDVLNEKVKEAGKKGDLQTAIEAAENALEIAQREIGKDSMETARALNNVANLYMYAGHPVESESLYKQAILIETEHHDKDSLTVADSFYNLGMAYAVQKKYMEARKVLERALKIRSEKLGTDHADTLKIRDAIDEIWNES